MLFVPQSQGIYPPSSRVDSSDRFFLKKGCSISIRQIIPHSSISLGYILNGFLSYVVAKGISLTLVRVFQNLFLAKKIDRAILEL